VSAREASVGHREAALAILLPRLEVRENVPLPCAHSAPSEMVTLDARLGLHVSAASSKAERLRALLCQHGELPEVLFLALTVQQVHCVLDACPS